MNRGLENTLRSLALAILFGSIMGMVSIARVFGTEKVVYLSL